MTVRRVIVGVDGRESSAAALDWAVAETVTVGSVLVIAHAVAHGPGASPARRSPDVPGGDPVLAEAVAWARHRLDADRIQPVLRSGRAGGVLVDLSFAEDLMVLGSPTHHQWWGPQSATSQVLELASCTVVVVPPQSSVAQRRASLGTSDWTGLSEPVVVGVLRSNVTPSPLSFGFAYASRHRLPLVAVSVTGQAGGEPWSDGQVSSGPSAAEPPAARLLHEQLTEFEREYPRVAVRRLVMPGGVGPGLVDASDGAALLVVGAEASGVGSVVPWLVDHAVCPIAVVRPH